MLGLLDRQWIMLAPVPSESELDRPSPRNALHLLGRQIRIFGKCPGGPLTGWVGEVAEKRTIFFHLLIGSRPDSSNSDTVGVGEFSRKVSQWQKLTRKGCNGHVCILPLGRCMFRSVPERNDIGHRGVFSKLSELYLERQLRRFTYHHRPKAVSRGKKLSQVSDYGSNYFSNVGKIKIRFGTASFSTE